eukprot:CAMPEP_0184324826 /NCGR_PEP_ID=MMETSP1049-20130417/137143_1 /TAXON_ID=77928 /ORGANISM="Proteomonas sulcata, Strain CCMP704" /LENGTH=153 /DNA_ID=CAMNT_0026646695 /DNA_START=518 /DNA_END=979 /DNA_ORIENTATION=+
MKTGVEIADLVGSDEDSEGIAGLLQETSWEAKQYPASGKLPASKYLTSKPLGLQLCFEREGGDAVWRLSAVHFYNNCDGMFRFGGDPLPHGLNLDMNNARVVGMLGEPDNKGGSTVPVWISYDKIGLQVNFKGKMWEDTDNPITEIVVYAKPD